MTTAIQYDGLREVLQSLAIVDHELYGALLVGLEHVGEVVRAKSSSDFIEYGQSLGGSPAKEASFVHTAEGFDTRVRPNTSTMAVLGIGQRMRKSRDLPRRRPNWGDLQMRHGLLKARAEKLEEAYGILETEVTELLHANGF